MSNNNNLPWDLNSSLRRNPSTATGASVIPGYLPHRYESRRSIASTSTAGPPPVSPRSGNNNNNNTNNNGFFRFSQRNSVGSPWAIPSAPSSPAPGPPPAIGTIASLDENLNPPSTRGGMPGQQQQQQRLSPLSIPEIGGAGSRTGSPSIGSVTSPHDRDQVRTPVQRPGSHLSSNSRNVQSRASMEAEFSQKHAQLVEQARLLLAEMKTLQVLGPIHSSTGSNTTQNTGNSLSDDGTNSSVFLQSQSDDASTSSYLSGSNSNSNTTVGTNPNNTALFYEQDEVSMASLGAILQGKLGSVVSRAPPRPARLIAREVVSRLGGIATSSVGLNGEPNDEGEAEVVEFLMEDYEAVLGWARASFSGTTGMGMAGQRLSSSGASSSSASQGQSQTQVRIQQCLNDRQGLLEAALPAYLAHLPAEAMMHFCHEKLYTSALGTGRARTPSASVHSGHTGTGYNGTLGVNGQSNGSPRSSGLPQQTYTNSHTFREGLSIDEIPRRRFLKTDDGYAWDMLELASALESDLLLSGSSSRGGRAGNTPPSLRNPVTRSFFTADDVSRILAHPMGRSLGPYPVERRRDVSPIGVRPVSPPPLPEPVAALDLGQGLSLNQGGASGGGIFGAGSPVGASYRPRLYGHDAEPEPADLGRRGLARNEENDAGGLDTDWSAQPPPPPPYRASPEPGDIPRSPASPPPPVPTADRATATASNNDSSYLPSYVPEPLRLRPYSPPSSPPPVLGAAPETTPAITSNSNTQRDTQNLAQHLPEPASQVPMPRPLPGSYPEDRDHETDDRSNQEYAPSSRYELLASPTSVPVPVAAVTSSSPVAAGRSTTPKLNTIPSIQELANGLASIRVPSAVVSSPRPAAAVASLNSPPSGGEYRSALLGNLHPNPASTSVTSLPSPPAIVSPTPIPPRPLSTTAPAPGSNRPVSTGASTGTGRRQFSFLPPRAAEAREGNDSSNNTSATEAPQSNTATSTATAATGWEAREREREREAERTRWANNDYLSNNYGVATPPPSGPIPVSSLNAAAAGGDSSSLSNTGAASSASGSGSGYRFSGYFSLGASHRNISLEESVSSSQSRPPVQQQQQQQVPRAAEDTGTDQIQRGRWETRERERELQRERERGYASSLIFSGGGYGYGHAGYGRSAAAATAAAGPNPFASSRDPSADGQGAASGVAGSGSSGRDEDWWHRGGDEQPPVPPSAAVAASAVASSSSPAGIPPPPHQFSVQGQFGAVAQAPAGIAEMDAGPFELGDAPPRIPELSGAGISSSRGGRSARRENVDDDDDDDDDARSREWMGELSSRR